MTYDFNDLPPTSQRILTRWVGELLTNAMLDPKVWAQVQAHKEEMYRTGRLKRPKPEGAMQNG